MEVSYKRDMNHTYMICRGEHPVDTSVYPVRMMLSNQWKAFLPCRIQGMDNQIFFYYDITSRQSLSSFFGTGKLNYLQLRSLVESLLAALEEAEEYLLNPCCILLEPSYIFWDSQEEEFFFCYIPGESPENSGNIQKLTEYLLPRIDHRDQQAVVLGYGVYRKVMEENFCGAQLKELLYQSNGKKNHQGSEKEENLLEIREEEDPLAWWTEDEEAEKGEIFSERKLRVGIETAGILLLGFLLLLAGTWAGVPLVAKLMLVVGALAAAGIRVYREFCKAVKVQESLPSETDSGNRNGQEERYLEKDEDEIDKKMEEPLQRQEKGTTLLFEEKTVDSGERFCLVPQGRTDLEPLRLEGEIFLVGKLRGTADLIIDVPTVSRIHARLEKRGDVYYIQDLNSKNGTRINKRELVGEEQIPLRVGDHVAFADAVYVFRQGSQEET